MKTYEQLYKEALERARIWKEKSGMPKDKQGILDDIFPELKKSEDERIKNAILGFLEGSNQEIIISGISIKDAISWLEKQGKVKQTCRNCQTFQDLHQNCPYSPIYQCTDLTEAHKRLDDETHCEFWIEKQGEPNNKIEPKFRVGDWVVSDCNNVAYVEFINGTKYVLCKDGYHEKMSIEYVDKCWHIWTIRDAKGGDVLVDKSNGTIGIFQSIGHHPDGGSYNDSSYCFLHCRYSDGYFYADFENGNTMDSDNAIPATEEQRAILFSKMEKEGYEWDSNKKELIRYE